MCSVAVATCPKRYKRRCSPFPNARLGVTVKYRKATLIILTPNREQLLRFTDWEARNRPTSKGARLHHPHHIIHAWSLPLLPHAHTTNGRKTTLIVSILVSCSEGWNLPTASLALGQQPQNKEPIKRLQIRNPYQQQLKEKDKNDTTEQHASPSLAPCLAYQPTHPPLLNPHPPPSCTPSHATL